MKSPPEHEDDPSHWRQINRVNLCIPNTFKETKMVKYGVCSDEISGFLTQRPVQSEGSPLSLCFHAFVAECRENGHHESFSKTDKNNPDHSQSHRNRQSFNPRAAESHSFVWLCGSFITKGFNET